MPRLRDALTRTNEHRLLGTMLALLHLSIWWDFDSPLSRSLMLAHLGVFLVWQPVWRTDRPIKAGDSLTLLLATLGFVYWLNWWLIFVWLIVLVALIGGRGPLDRRERVASLVALAIVICELLIGAVTPMFAIPLDPHVELLFRYAPLVLALLLFVWPPQHAERSASLVMDPIHGLNIALLTTILALSSLLIMYTIGVEYPIALVQAMLGIAAFLFAISWLSSPHLGFTGLGYFWTRYLLNIGTPFEEWLGRLAQLARTESGPEQFLNRAMDQLQELTWISGLRWHSAVGQGERGATTAHARRVSSHGLEVWLYTPRPASTTLLLHGTLLVRVIAHFLAAKAAERELAQRSYLQAIHETGARVTHDIKNLLQSLHTLTVAVEQAGPERASELQQLMQRQLPHLSNRLKLSLEKLQSARETATHCAPVKDWWGAFRARNAGDHVAFSGIIKVDADIPADCFDSVAENLLENARQKRQLASDVSIEVKLVANDDELSLRVCDTGDAVAQEIAATLFQAPVASSRGYGIGLYQAARQAQRSGYKLQLLNNDTGQVCFELSRA